MGNDPKTKEETLDLIQRLFAEGTIPGTFTRTNQNEKPDGDKSER